MTGSPLDFHVLYRRLKESTVAGDVSACLRVEVRRCHGGRWRDFRHGLRQKSHTARTGLKRQILSTILPDSIVQKGYANHVRDSAAGGVIMAVPGFVSSVWVRFSERCSRPKTARCGGDKFMDEPLGGHCVIEH